MGPGLRLSGQRQRAAAWTASPPLRERADRLGRSRQEVIVARTAAAKAATGSRRDVATARGVGRRATLVSEAAGPRHSQRRHNREPGLVALPEDDLAGGVAVLEVVVSEDVGVVGGVDHFERGAELAPP